MDFLLGIGAAVIGNCVIGAGQCLQKYALNRLQTTYALPSSLTRSQTKPPSRSTGSSATNAHGWGQSGIARNGPMARNSSHSGENTVDMGSVAKTSRTSPLPVHRDLLSLDLDTSVIPASTHELWQQYTVPRYQDRLWLLGVGLNYCGEIFGNSLALSYLSAAVVTPLGIIAVLVNLFTAQRVLGERISRVQKRGCGWIVLGVCCILFVAPKDATFIPQTGLRADPPAQQFLKFLSAAHPFTLLTILILIQLGLTATASRARHPLVLYVLIASLFGSINIMASKTITTYLRLLTTSLVDNGPASPFPVEGFPEVVTSVDDTSILTSALSIFSYELSPGLPLFAWSTLGVLVTLAISVVGQEYYKQQALSRYPLLQVQPLFFAIFNVAAVLMGLVLFREIHGVWALMWFIMGFSTGIWLIIKGSQLLQEDTPDQPSILSHPATLRKMTLFKQK
ncbi:hypothetical protein IWQ62_000768 [Dispira parvispora]|uniref:Uncharacterized protein n=1 Tax=Dispira parvispora TaxID=1520584 RepID=A0A9W8ATS2_9FUNG|nr:hypothetical protein IWQ62_000768 [Dispira parvispora]